jgi:hypothetical protein
MVTKRAKSKNKSSFFAGVNVSTILLSIALQGSSELTIGLGYVQTLAYNGGEFETVNELFI